MRLRSPSSAIFATVGAGLLLLGLLSLRHIPFYEPFWGLDFQNLYAFQTCTAAIRAGIYSVSGEVCGDALGRSFLYPPAMFGVFSWVRLFTFSQALAIWDAATILAMLGVGAAWLWLDRRTHSGWRTVLLSFFWLGMMTGYPFVFALERSNNDIIPLVLWTGAAALFVSRRFALSGGLMGAAVMLKVYPAVAVAVVAIGLVRSRLRQFALFATGGLIVAVLAAALWWPDTVHYLTFVLPNWAARTPVLSPYNHVVQALPFAPLITIGLAAILLGSWAIASWRRLTGSPVVILAGSLAISTYFSSTSFDYNLVSTYPLLMLAAARALDPDRTPAWKVISLVSIFSIVAGRGLIAPVTLVLLQIASLVGIALLVTIEHQADQDGALKAPVGENTRP